MKRAFWFLVWCIGNPLISIALIVGVIPCLLWLTYIDRDMPLDDPYAWWWRFCRKKSGLIPRNETEPRRSL